MVMNKHTVMIVIVTAILVLVAAPRLRALPVVSKLPTF